MPRSPLPFFAVALALAGCGAAADSASDSGSDSGSTTTPVAEDGVLQVSLAILDDAAANMRSHRPARSTAASTSSSTSPRRA